MNTPRAIKLVFLYTWIVFFIVACNSRAQEIIELKVPARETGQTDILQLKCDPIPTVRVGFIGIGMRGIGAVKRFTYIKDVEIKAICDLEQYNLDKAQDILIEREFPKAEEYIGEEAWKQLCERDDIDLIYICTHWAEHTPMAVYAMEQGKHVAVEVPASRTIDECWQLVNTAEKTRKHCMQLENCCYDFFEMATLNMAQQGIFGEVVHVEGAYIHDLRELNFNERLSEQEAFEPGVGNIGDGEKVKRPGLKGYWDYWRLKENRENDGNLYPTHGLGPVCQILNIHRGDKMNYLVSLSSHQFNMTAYAEWRFGKDSEQAQTPYREGDMNVSLIKTEKGKSMMIQHDVVSPRPYSRIHLVSGTKGFAQKWPQRTIALEPNAHKALKPAEMDSLLNVYKHPIVEEVGELAKSVGGHGGMDFIMDYRLVYCLQKGLPLDQDVYDAAEWSCITELSKISVANSSAPVRVPDFTRGAWDKLKGLQLAY